jgi:hypothetical protein
MKTQFRTFYTDGQNMVCLHTHFIWKDGYKFYQYSIINSLIGKTFEDYIHEDVVDDFFGSFLLLEDYFRIFKPRT